MMYREVCHSWKRANEKGEMDRRLINLHYGYARVSSLSQIYHHRLNSYKKMVAIIFLEKK